MYAQAKEASAISGGYAVTGLAQQTVGYVPEAAPRAPELPIAMEQLEKALYHLSDLAERLDNRLTGVVARPHVPTPETKAAGKALMSTGLGNQLDTMNDRVQATAMRLQSVLDRLEF